ncbi:MAG: peroxide stress protein YaaA [Clostridia bacterium]|nr:peroxide stress protein YaaA [Clostridia bacterium]
MKIIISPAKKMNVDNDSLVHQDLPVFLNQTELLCKRLKEMSYAELKALWKCNDKIAALNVERLQHMDLRKNLTPAILSYEGIQYQYMAPSVFTVDEFSYIQDHLRILSGFYGVLRPFDGVVPYRLEMQAKLPMGEAKDLYSFWGDSLANHLFAETDCIINLASKEYSLCVSKYLPEKIRFISCIFGEWKDGKIIEKGTICKMARGEMVRYMAENQIEEPERIKEFSRLNYQYSIEHSDNNTYVFLVQE